MVINFGGLSTNDFCFGELYLITSEENGLFKNLDIQLKHKYINFPHAESIKVISYFEKIPSAEMKSLKLYLLNNFSFKVGESDFFGKLLIDVFSLIKDNDVLIVELSGLGDDSIQTLIHLLKLFLKNNDQKLLLLRQNRKPQFSKMLVGVI